MCQVAAMLCRRATEQVHFVLDRTESQAAEDHCEGFMKVFFKIELSKSRRSTCSSTRRWTGHAHGRERVEGLAAKFKFFAVLVVDAEIVLHCVGRRDNVTGILYGRVILQLRWTQWLWLWPGVEAKFAGVLAASRWSRRNARYRQRLVRSCCVRSSFLMKL